MVSAIAAAMWGGLASVSLLLGAALALRWTLSDRLTGAVMGFGSGALVSSIAYELVPESLVAGGGRWMVFAFAAGALTFFAADWAIDRSGGAERKRIARRQGADRAPRSSWGRCSTACPSRSSWAWALPRAARSASHS